MISKVLPEPMTPCVFEILGLHGNHQGVFVKFEYPCVHIASHVFKGINKIRHDDIHIFMPALRTVTE